MSSSVFIKNVSGEIRAGWYCFVFKTVSFLRSFISQESRRSISSALCVTFSYEQRVLMGFLMTLCD